MKPADIGAEIAGAAAAAVAVHDSLESLETAHQGAFAAMTSIFADFSTDLNDKADKTVPLAVTLPTTGWSGSGPYTITRPAAGVTPTSLVLISPAPAGYAAYAECGVRCTAQGTNTLTFAAESIPTAAITVNVGILG